MTGSSSAMGTARPNKWPCARRHPAAKTVSACVVDSIPSAMTSRSSASHSPMTERYSVSVPIGLGADRQASVELDDLNRQCVQIGQRVVSRTEIVQGDLDAKRIEPVDLRGRVGDIDDRHRLRDLDDQLARRHSMPCQRRLHLPLEVVAAEPCRADVHVEDEVQAGRLDLAARQIQHHGVELGTQPGGLRRGNECSRVESGFRWARSIEPTPRPQPACLLEAAQLVGTRG